MNVEEKTGGNIKQSISVIAACIRIHSNKPFPNSRAHARSTHTDTHIQLIWKSFIAQIKLMKSHKPAGQFNRTSFRDNNIGRGIFGDKIWRNNHVQVADLENE